jgi:hypothetical protein
VRYGVLNAEATRSAPGKGWKLNRSNPRSLLKPTRVPVAGLSPFGGSATRSFGGAVVHGLSRARNK